MTTASESADRPAAPSHGIGQRFVMLLGLIRFSHTIFALPFAALATVMAITTPLDGGEVVVGIRQILAILLCMVFARSVAMAFNRLVDQRFDAANPRTAGRHLPAGLLRRGEVWAFTLICVAGFIGSTLLFLPNRLPLLGSVPVLVFLCGYSLAKRFTSAAHLWLGVALALSPICVWLALRGAVSINDLLPALLLAGGIAAWVTGFDIIYACQDAAFDKSAGLNSVPARLGIAGALRLAAASHFITVLFLAAIPLAAPQVGLGAIYGTAVAIVAGLLWYEHRLVSPDDLDRVNQAFFNVNAAISLLLLVAGGLDCVM
jgi:4-hydroxybenzoate polyprenyltransferase